MAAAKEFQTGYSGAAPGSYAYRFDAFYLDPEKRILTRAGRNVALPPKVFDTLVALVESAGHPVANSTLMGRIWPGAPVEESQLKFHVSQVGMALGDDRFIETLPPLGYRFIADLERIELDPPGPRLAPLPVNKASRKWIYWGAGGLAAAAIGIAAWRALPSFDEPPPHPLKSITVVPLEAKNADDQALAHAIAKGLVPRLESIPSMKVVLGTGGEAVLGGTLERGKTSVVAKVHLRPANGGPEIFSETFDIPASQIFSIEPIVAKRVAIALKSRLSPAQEANLLRLPTQNSEAYRIYSELPAEPAARITALEKVVKLDPEFSSAYANLAETYRAAAFASSPISTDKLAKAKAHAEKALSIDGTLPDAHVVIGYALLFNDWDPEGAAKSASRALELGPNSAGAHALQAHLLTAQKKFDEALAEWKKASAATSDDVRFGPALTHYFAHRYDRAVEEYRSAIAKAPPTASAVRMLARCLRLKGAKDDAFVEYTRADLIARAPDRPGLKKAYEKEGFEGYWKKKLKGRMGNYETAVAFIESGRDWRAFKPLAQALEARAPELVFVHLDPVMDAIRKDDRFRNMVREIGIAK